MLPQGGVEGDIAVNPLLHMPRKPEEVEHHQGRRIKGLVRDASLGLGRKTVAKGHIQIRERNPPLLGRSPIDDGAGGARAGQHRPAGQGGQNHQAEACQQGFNRKQNFF